MLAGRLYIDGDDAYKQYGVYVVKGGWNDLVAFPPLKSVTSNDWQEEDGIEADLSNPVLNSREVQLKIAIGGEFSRFPALIDHLSDGSYHTFECVYLKRTYRLRLVAVPNMTVALALGTATLKLADDFPLNGYKYRIPDSSVVPAEDYKFDGWKFTDYGVRVLKGTLAEVLKPSNVKQNLLRNLSTLSGAIYDPKNVRFKSKDVKVYCLMRAESLDELWRNYDALLFDLIRPDEHLLYVEELEQEFPFHYKSCQVQEFFPTDKIWLRFTLTLTFTHSFRIEDGDVVLAAEDGAIVFTQDDINAIEMLPDRFTYPSVRFVNNRTVLRLTGNGSIRFNN